MAQSVFLVHHAEALPAYSDALRPLSSRGEAQAERVARAAAARAARPLAIWHSGKLRAEQTAAAWLRIVNPEASFAAVAGLCPEDDPDTAALLIAADTQDLAVASHMPFLPALLHRLVTGRRDRRSAAFPLNGCVALTRIGDRFEEQWRVGPGD